MPALELDAIEARILGVLIEKETTTPEQYPLSLNALAAGCNQRSNRDPVLELGESEVAAGIERLRRKSLVGAAHASGSRVERYKHAAATVWQLSGAELAVLAELLLRGAQMPGELRGRADRMSRLETLDALAAVLEGLRQKGFVQRLEPLPGARAPQWDQIVAQRGPAARAAAPASRTPLAEGALPIARVPAAAPAAAPGQPSALEARVTALEAEVARLRGLLEALASAPGPR
jgi:hypothetical protein